MTTKITFFLLLISSQLTLLANSPTPFWFEDFTNGIPNNWTSEDETGNGIEWAYCEEFLSCTENPFIGELIPHGWFQSNSFEDGHAMIKPNEGLAGNLIHRSVLTTPVIDCSNKNEVFLQFNTFIIADDSEPESDAIIQVKIDNGPWISLTVFKYFDSETMEEGRLGLQSYNPHKAFFDLSSIAANEEEVQIRWLWKYSGNNELFWGVDDVELLDSNPLYEKAIWGHQPGQGDFASSLGNWSVIGTVPCGWTWDQTGLVDTPDSNEKADFYTNSATLDNGIALLYSGSCYPELTYTELVSPVIDLSMVPNGAPMDLKFYQAGALGNPNPDAPFTPISRLMISYDGGMNYPDEIELNSDKAYQKVFSETMTIQLPFDAIGAPQFRLKFVFEGTDIFWAIDDVRIVERSEVDLKVAPVFFTVAPNFSTPAFAVNPITLSAEVVNVGSATVDFSTLYVEIRKDFSSEVVFKDTLLVGALAPNASTEGLVFSKKFHPEPWQMNYTCRYWIEADGEDEDQNNDAVYWKFQVSDDLFSKNKGPSSINGSFWPSNQIDYEIGNCFFIPPGAGMEATNVRFAFGNKQNVFGTNLIIKLYKWKTDNTFADANNDTIANVNEIELVTFNEFNTAVFTSDTDPLSVVYSHPISTFGPTVPLEDSTYYFVTIEYNDDDTNSQIFPIAGSEEIDYTSTFLQSFEDSLPRYTSMLKLDNGDFKANSWGLRRIPYIQLEVEKKTTEVVSLDSPKKGIDFKLFPNPADQEIKIEFRELEKIRNGRIEILDMFGRLVLNRQIENKFVSQIPIQTTGLSNGSYILRVVSEKQSGSKLFTIIKEK